MKVLGQFTFLLLLGGIWCENSRNGKAAGKATKKSAGQQGGDASPSAPVVALSSRGSGGAASSRGSGADSGREGAAGARAARQQTDEMRLHFLKNTQVTCNDGTAAG